MTRAEIGHGIALVALFGGLALWGLGQRFRGRRPTYWWPAGAQLGPAAAVPRDAS